MKKPRVIIETVVNHRIYVEHSGGERTLYAVTDKLKEAKGLAKGQAGVGNCER
jgi:hypothetical protein